LPSVSRISWRHSRAISPASAPLPVGSSGGFCCSSVSIRCSLTPGSGSAPGPLLRLSRLWRRPVRRPPTVSVLAARRLHRLQRLQRSSLTAACRSPGERGRRSEVLEQPPLLPDANRVLGQPVEDERR